MNEQGRIYLDHNATTPLREEVVEAMVRVLRDVPGNPSSTHAEGAVAKRLISEAREQVAACLGTRAREIVFTGGATEANNMVLRGLLVDSNTGSGSWLLSLRWHGEDIGRVRVQLPEATPHGLNFKP